MAPKAKTVVRVHNVEYVDAWRERQLDFDLLVSPEEESAHAISRAIGLPAARQTDVFADGQVVIVELDVQAGPGSGAVLGSPLREASIPEESRIAGIVRHGEHVLPGGDEILHPGDRVIVIASPAAARAWSAMMARDDEPVDDVVIYGAGGTGASTARLLLEQGIRVRLVEPDPERAREVGEIAEGRPRLPDGRLRLRLPRARTGRRLRGGSGRGGGRLQEPVRGDAAEGPGCRPDDRGRARAAVLARSSAGRASTSPSTRGR